MASSALTEVAQVGGYASLLARTRSNYQASTSHTSPHLQTSLLRHSSFEGGSVHSVLKRRRSDKVALCGRFRAEDRGFASRVSFQKRSRRQERECRKPVRVLEGGANGRHRGDVTAGAVSIDQGGNAALLKENLLPVEVELSWKPPKWAWRALSAALILGQVASRILRGKIHKKNTLEQLAEVGPGSLGVCLLTASFVGMVFTIQFVREFARLGLTRSVGGVLALALSRELTPVVTAIILAGRVGSAFAAELGTMQVSEQTDTLRVLRTDPVDYLITPRVIACSVAMPCLTVFCFTVGMAASVLLADAVYSVSSNIILDSAARALSRWDLVSTLIKSTIFGVIISVISCAWGVTTNGGAKGVGESTTSAVVISLVVIFIADFILSFVFFQGAGDSLKAALG